MKPFVPPRLFFRLTFLFWALVTGLAFPVRAGTVARPTIYAFNVAGETTINRGTTATLNWSVSQGATVSLSPGVGVVAGTTVDVTPTETTTYTLTASNAGGAVTKTKKITVIVPPVLQSLTGTTASVAPGSAAKLSWTATGAAYYKITSDTGANFGNTVATSLTVRPQVTTTYTVVAANTAGTDQRTITVSVASAPPKPVIGVFTATLASVNAGESTTLSWQVTGADSVSISPGMDAVTGTSVSVTPTVSTTYTLTATNGGGTVTKSAAVTVNVPGPVITAFAAAPASIVRGNSTTLSWGVAGATTVALGSDTDANSAIVTGTSVSVSPTTNTTYTLTASNGSAQVSRDVAVTVTDPAAGISIDSLTATPGNVQPGDAVTLAWTVTNADSLWISADNGGDVGDVRGRTSVVVHPQVTTHYTLVAYSSTYGQAYKSVDVTVGTPPPPPVPVITAFAANPASIAIGTSTTLNWSVSGADYVSIAADNGTGPGEVTGNSASVRPTVSTTYTLTATNTYGSVSRATTVAVTGPTAPVIGSFVANPAFIQAGGNSTLSWSVSGADSISISTDTGDAPGSVTGSTFTVSPTVTTQYTLTAKNDIGTSTAIAVVTLYTSGNGSVWHPRVWVTQATLPTLVQRAAANDVAWLRLRADCDAYASMPVTLPDQTRSGDTINGGYQYNDYLKPSEELSLGYLIARSIDPTRAARYAAKERELLLALSDPVYHGRPSTDSGYGIRGYVPAMAIGYDWIYDTLSDADRAQIFTEINRWVEYFDASGFGRNFPQGNYFAGYYSAKALGALATEGENPKAAAMWDDWLNRIHYGLVQPYHAQWLSGGGAPDGWNYGQLETINMLRAIAAAYTAKGLNLIHDATKPFTYPDGHARWMTHFTWPDMKSVSDRGFVYDNDNPSWTDAAWATQYNGLLRLAGGDNAPLMQRYALDLRALQPSVGIEPWVEFLFQDNAAPVAEYRTALSYRTIGDGQVAMRSSWATDAVWGAFQAGPYTGYSESSEEFFDEGSLAIQRGGVQFLVNGWGALMRNTPGTADSGGSLFTRVYDELFGTQTDGVYHGRRLFNTYMAVRSDGYWGQVAAGPGETSTTLSRFEDGGSYVLMRGANLEGMYLNGHPITGWTRTVAYLRPNVFVVYDRTSLTTANVDNWMAWHVSAAPTEITAATSGIHSFDVADTRAAFGSYLYRGRVTTLLPEGNQVTTVDTFGKGKVYRLEVRTAAPAPASTWLTVFDAAASAAAAGTSTPLTLEAGNVLAGAVEGALVTTPDGNASVALFSKTGLAIIGGITLALPAANTHCVVADLQPNTGYAVTVTTVDGHNQVQIAPGGTLTTTSGGTLEFTAPASAAQAVR